MHSGLQSQLFSDTDPNTESVLIELLKKKNASEKLRMADQLNATLRTLTLSGLRKRYPKADKRELKVKLAEHLYGAELAQKILAAAEHSS